jgi:hypothetical protein
VLPVEYGGLDSFTRKWGDSYASGNPADFRYVYHNCDFKSNSPQLAFHPLQGTLAGGEPVRGLDCAAVRALACAG